MPILINPYQFNSNHIYHITVYRQNIRYGWTRKLPCIIDCIVDTCTTMNPEHLHSLGYCDYRTITNVTSCTLPANYIQLRHAINISQALFQVLYFYKLFAHWDIILKSSQHWSFIQVPPQHTQEELGRSSSTYVSPRMLYIVTNVWVLRTPNAGRYSQFQHFLNKKAKKARNLQQKTFF